MNVKQATIELKKAYRDFLINNIWENLSVQLLGKLNKGKEAREKGVIYIDLDEYDLDLLIGGLTVECNYNEDQEVRSKAHKIKIILKSYRKQLML